MKSKFHTFGYFSSCLTDTMYEVYEVLDNKQHSERKKLLNDINSIEKLELEKFVNENNIGCYTNRIEGGDFERKLFFFIHLMNKDIATNRIEKLLDTKDRPSPYNSENLQSITIYKHNLVSIKDFNLKKNRIEKGDYVYTLCPILEQSNSSYWISYKLLEFAKELKLNFKIRLDPFTEVPIKAFNLMKYKMLVHGKKLEWERLINLRNDDFGQWFNEKENDRVGFTDYIWAPKDNEIHFTCEELPKETFNGKKISRYFHAIFKKDTGGIIHCDGALRVYSECELLNRLRFHVKESEVRKVGARIKIFQYNSNENDGKEIDQDAFCQLVISFFIWNDDVQEYFN
jgi:hypothetical protein